MRRLATLACASLMLSGVSNAFASDAAESHSSAKYLMQIGAIKEANIALSATDYLAAADAALLGAGLAASSAGRLIVYFGNPLRALFGYAPAALEDSALHAAGGWMLGASGRMVPLIAGGTILGVVADWVFPNASEAATLDQYYASSPQALQEFLALPESSQLMYLKDSPQLQQAVDRVYAAVTAAQVQEKGL